MEKHIAYFKNTSDFQAIENLRKFKIKENELVRVLKNKVEKDDELSNYLSEVEDRKRVSTINYIDRILKQTEIIKNRDYEINKYTNVLNSRIQFEIDVSERKSTEVAINILNSSYSKLNNKLKEIEENFSNSFSGEEIVLKTGNKNIIINMEV